MTDPIAQTTSGKVSGRTVDGVQVFRGIPFAAPPVGARRFRAPEPPQPWDGVRACTEPGPACVQLKVANRHPGLFEPTGAESEDCLYLDVWTPACDDAKRPVLVWIHGGVFFMGSGSMGVYDGTRFAEHDAVIVTINYRLGGLGFAYLDGLFDGLQTSNLGMLDMIRALAWVQENIAAFGGDPGRVTIFGESAGGMACGTLLAMPPARGLFHRASPQSGAAHNSLPVEKADAVARTYLELIGIAPGDTDTLLSAPAERFILGYESLQVLGAVLEDPTATFGFPFQPVIDGTTLPTLPIEAVAEGAAKGVDVLVGTTSEEMRLVIWDMRWEDFGLTLDQALTQFSEYGHLVADTGRPEDEVTKLYRASIGEDVTAPDIWAAIATDRVMAIPAIRLAEAQAKHHDKVFMYRFGWRCPVDEALGAMHALDIPFFFDNLGNPLVREHLTGDDAPQQLADAMHGSLVAFAATGDPNNPAVPDWPAYDETRRATMDFTMPPRLVDDPDGERRALYEGVL